MLKSSSFRAVMGAVAVAALVAVAGCSQPSQEAETPPPAAAPTAEAPAAPTAPAEVVTVSVGGLTGSSDAGEKVFRQCMSCHAVAEGQNMVGPSLHNIVGRTAGQVEGFKYSEANANSGLVWSEDQLFTYLENPQATIPGTIMAFAGLKKPQDRADVIAYLKANSPGAQ